MEEFAYERSDIHLEYEQARALPPDTVKLWLETIAKAVDRRRDRTIIDVGCGTGRFTAALAGHFDARVLGVDPSLNMLRRRRTPGAQSSIIFVRGAAERLPVRSGSADVVFISMAYHHLPDKSRAVRECRQALRDRGMLLIRTSTVESMDSYLWLDFFPAARRIELDRAPSRAGLPDFIGANGFMLHSHTVVHQRFADSLADYAEKIGRRGLSSLQQIPDKDFHCGMSLLKQYCRAGNPATPVEEDIDLFVFEKTRPVEAGAPAVH
jgi:SAM-dependent methyltransferase